MEHNKLSFSSYQKYLITILALLQFTVILDFMVISPLGDILMKSLDITPARFGIVVSSYAFAAGISGIIAAGIADRFDRKKLLLFFYSGFIIGTLFCSFANSYLMLLAARIFTGFFGGVIGAISLAIVTDMFSINQRGRVMGYIQMAFAGSQVLGIPLGLYVSTVWSWHASFTFIVILACIITALILLKLKPVNEHLKLQKIKTNPFKHLWSTISNRTYQTGFISTAFLSIGGFMLMPFGSAYLVNNILIPQEKLPLVFMFTGISSIIIMPFIGKLSDKIDKYKIFTAGSILAIIMILIYTNIPPLPMWQVIGINMILFMGIMSRMIPSTALTSTIPEMQDRGAFMSINSSLQQLAGGMAAVIAGNIVHQETKTSPLEHYNYLGFTVSVVILMCLYFVYKVNVIAQSKMQTPLNTSAPLINAAG